MTWAQASTSQTFPSGSKVGGEIEFRAAGPGSAFAPERHRDLSLCVRLVDDMGASVYQPNVSFWIYAHGVGAAGVTSRWPVNGRIPGASGYTVAGRNGHDLAKTEQAVAPRPPEISIGVELQHRMGAPGP